MHSSETALEQPSRIQPETGFLRYLVDPLVASGSIVDASKLQIIGLTYAYPDY